MIEGVNNVRILITICEIILGIISSIHDRDIIDYTANYLIILGKAGRTQIIFSEFV